MSIRGLDGSVFMTEHRYFVLSLLARLRWNDIDRSMYAPE